MRVMATTRPARNTVGGRRQKLNLLDRSWLLVDRARTPMHVGCLAVLSVPTDASADLVAGMVEQMRQATDYVRPFNLRLRPGRLKSLLPRWEELPADSIDLDYHVRHSILAPPGGERELGVVVSQLHSRPMDMSRPLWECHVIEGLAGGRFAVYFRVHHATLDGVALMRRMQRMFSADPAHDLAPVWVARSQRRRRARDGATGSQGGGPGALPGRVAFGLKAARSVAATVAGLEMERQRRRHPGPHGATPFGAQRSILNRRVTERRRVATESMDVGFVKQVADAAGATVNDVFLTICSAALRRYLAELGTLPDLDLTAGTPVDLRDSGDGSAGNAFSMMLVNLHTQLVGPVARMHAVRASAEHAKNKLWELPKVVRDNYGALLLAPYMAQLVLGLGGRGRPPFNVILSNIRAPDEAMYLGGARLELCYPMSLVTDGQALSITVLSAGGRFDIGFVGCPDTLPHLQRIALYSAAALRELAAALDVPAP
ncbi:MAG: wax ester/triacylglycerol synthase family O-acyltransferase [Pseudonocardiaceae bacterium]|nr:wax ester/triacylglycerol synthase family O-acyltransferase [Pseudonocardiaceae bacterium]